MQITFEFDGLTVSAEAYYDRAFGFMLREFHVSLNGADFEGKLDAAYVKRLEGEALNRATGSGKSW